MLRGIIIHLFFIELALAQSVSDIVKIEAASRPHIPFFQNIKIIEAVPQIKTLFKPYFESEITEQYLIEKMTWDRYQNWLYINLQGVELPFKLTR